MAGPAAVEWGLDAVPVVWSASEPAVALAVLAVAVPAGSPAAGAAVGVWAGAGGLLPGSPAGGVVAVQPGWLESLAAELPALPALCAA